MNPETRDSYGVRIDGIHRRGILPEKVVDVGRFDVHVASGAVIEGAILCRDLNIDGDPFEVHGSIMATGSVVIHCGANSGLIGGPSVAGGVFHVDCANRSGRRVTFLGDVSADRVRLVGAIVLGSVLGREVELYDCLVLGSVYAAENLTIADTLCATFIAQNCTSRNSVILLLDSAIVYDEFSVEGRVFMAFLYPWFGQGSSTAGLIPLSRADRKFLDVEREDQDTEHLTILGCDDRVVDLLPFQDIVGRNSTELEKRIEEILASMPSERCRLCEALEAQLDQLFEARIWSYGPAECPAEQEQSTPDSAA